MLLQAHNLGDRGTGGTKDYIGVVIDSGIEDGLPEDSGCNGDIGCNRGHWIIVIWSSMPVTNDRIIVENGVLEVKPGEILTFNCTVKRGTDPSFMRFYNDKEVNQTSGLYQVKEEGNVLYVESAKIIMEEHTCSIMDSTAALRPVVTFNPPWSNILTGDSVTLSCNVTSTGQGYSWYKDSMKIKRNTKNFTIIGASIGDNGDYQCKTRNTDYSHGVRLNVSNAYVVLQAPYTIVEGEDLTLRCHSRPQYNVIRTVFYKDGEIIQTPDTNYLYFKRVNLSISGTYRCDRELEFRDSNRTYRNQAFVSIQDLFSYPIIRTSSDIVTEGDNLVISCDTTLNPLRPDTKLRFAFYKNNLKFRKFTSSNKYTISAQLDDAGEYSCEVKSSTDHVRKKSNVLYVQVQDSDIKLALIGSSIAVALLVLLLVCIFLLFKFRHGAASSLRNCCHKEPKAGGNEDAHRNTQKPGSEEADGQWSQIPNDGQKENNNLPARDLPDDDNVCYTYIDISRVPKAKPAHTPVYYMKSNECRFSPTPMLGLQCAKVSVQNSWRPRCAAVAMSALVLVILLSAGKPVLSLNPSWTKILTGDSVTLTCNVASTEQGAERYVWNRDGTTVFGNKSDFTIQYAKVEDNGDYQCWFNYTISNTVRLDVHDDFVILQVPHTILEGEDLLLRCHSKPEFKVKKTIFYKDDINIFDSSSDSIYIKKRVDMDSSGTYECVQILEIPSVTQKFMDQTSVSIQAAVMGHSAALRPVVTFTPPWSKILSSESVALSCNVSSTEHGYSWMKNRIKIPIYTMNLTIMSPTVLDGGDYQCRSTTSDYGDVVGLNVSDAFVILQAPYTIVEGGDLTLRCHSKSGYNVKTTKFFKDGEIIQTPYKNSLHFERVNISISGTYSCARELEFPASIQIYSDQALVSIQENKQMDNDSRDYTLQNIIRLSLSVCLLIIASCFIYHHIKNDDTQHSSPPSA
ncbi:uncharacterized protein O3C94_011973 [Discoglossus pictus]